MGSLKITVWLVVKVVARVWKLLGCLRVEKNSKKQNGCNPTLHAAGMEVQFSEEQGLKVDTETHIVLLRRAARNT